jgi:hypothetical protein
VRRTVGLGLIVAFCAAAASPPAATAAPAPQPATTVVVLEDQGVLQPGATARFSHQCPARAPHPAGGTFGPPDGSPLAGQYLLTASYPLERTGWRVVLHNLTPMPQPFFAGAVCLGADVRFVYPRTTGVAGPGAEAGANLACPKTAPRAIGGFFRPQAAGGLGQLVADGSFRTRAGWDTGVRNIGPTPQGYVAGAVCTEAALRTATVTRERTVAPGAALQTRLQCPRATPVPVAPLFAAADAAARGQIVATDAFRTGARTWLTGVRNISPQPQRAGVGVVCVR